jgi:hypothetical protein
MTVKNMPFKDSAFGSAGKTMTFSYAPLDSADVPVTNDNRPRTTSTSILGTAVSKNYHVYKTNAAGEYVEITERCSDPSKPYGDAANLRTVKTIYASDTGISSGRVKTIERPDGTLETYSYELGTYAPGSAGAPGTFTPGTGDAMRTTITHGTTASPAGIFSP